MKKKSYSDQCLERAENATKGPWETMCLFGSWDLPVQINDMKDNTIVKVDTDCRNVVSNCNFIAASRTDVPELARRLKKACEALKQYKEVISEIISVLENKDSNISDLSKFINEIYDLEKELELANELEAIPEE